MDAGNEVSRANHVPWSYTRSENLDSAAQEKVNKLKVHALTGGVDQAVGSVSF